ncbi:similar to Saccharomyces cerevisiae YDR252W BTT1 Beta3 subunit of the heterotrimeric nascent polypeptide-associated complex [Maudiozyma saulgeensis]|uniref:Nascent polypeptide-associated complex subunit beta n=1 Tax=Maudiozyma saulgeensis TaxID=1789683 RepID=A0A1X7R865_9SACH|nr:similar to Saccharomyces cerevisiae YDR252W BTT1 Beta3 subunit of the heterotrimeric nascent polypeptide-associated complex [Kazachstania saulgeensis]
MPIDQEKLAKLQALSNKNKVGGARRKTGSKVAGSATAVARDDSKLYSTIAKLNGVTVDNVAEANFFHEDGSVMHFSKVGLQMAKDYNTSVVYGLPEKKKLDEMFPQILPQLGAEAYQALAQLEAQLKEFDEKKKNEEGAKVEDAN